MLDPLKDGLHKRIGFALNLGNNGVDAALISGNGAEGEKTINFVFADESSRFLNVIVKHLRELCGFTLSQSPIEVRSRQCLESIHGFSRIGSDVQSPLLLHALAEFLPDGE